MHLINLIAHLDFIDDMNSVFIICILIFLFNVFLMHRMYTCTWFGIYIHLIIHCDRGKCSWMILLNHFICVGRRSRVVKSFLKHGEVIWLLASSINFNMKQLLMYTYVGIYIRGQEYIVYHKLDLFSDIKKSLTINFKCACVRRETVLLEEFEQIINLIGLHVKLCIVCKKKLSS